MSEAREHFEAWLRLSLTPGLSRAAARELLAAFGVPADGLAAGRGALAARIGAPLADRLLSVDAVRDSRVAAALDWAAQPNHHLIALDDHRYPSALLQAPDPPLLLYLTGDALCLNQPMIAIVGSRSATPSGAETAEQFACALGEAGLTVVSGLALGIDAAAHRGALTTAAGTVAVMGTGVDRIQPARHRDLAHQIANRGALISELALGSPGLPAHFPARNRIIAGLSRGVLVVEAAIHSGSLITARIAGEIGRDVFAMPGSIHSPVARGCHKLIRDGAKLVESVDDVLTEFGLRAPAAVRSTTARPQPIASIEANLDDSDRLLLNSLDPAPITLDRLLERAGVGASAAGASLTRLELAGTIERLADGRVRRRPNFDGSPPRR